MNDTINKFALSIPGYGEIATPPKVPTGGVNTAGNIISVGITLFLIFIIILVFIYIIWGGLNWMMSQGDKSKIEAARLKISWAIVGLIVAFISFVIINILSFFFGVNYFGLPANEVSPLPACVNAQYVYDRGDKTTPVCNCFGQIDPNGFCQVSGMPR